SPGGIRVKVVGACFCPALRERGNALKVAGVSGCRSGNFHGRGVFYGSMSPGFSRFILFALALLFACGALGAPRRVMSVTATEGYRHSDAIEASIDVLQELARESGVLEIVNTEDVSLIQADTLRDFDAVYFFTSGELPLTDQQKADLLDFVRQGKGFGGSHSATDCLYSWPEYGDLIGGYFDGH